MSDSPFEAGEAHLAGLAERFLQALAARSRNDVDVAAELLRAVLRVEPRLAEPRLELARILLDTGALEEAEAQAREGLRILEGGGQWTEDLPENVLLALAWDLLGEILRIQADQDDVVFGDPARFAALVAEAKAAFRRAAALDPTNEHAAAMAFGFDPGSAQDEGDDA